MNEEIKTTTEEESQDNSVTREDTETLIVSNNGITSTKDIGKLVSALAKAQINFDNISKDAKNPFFKSLYSSLDEIIRATRRHLAKEELVLFQFVTGDQNLVSTVSRLSHSSGQWIESSMSCKPAKQDIQMIGAISSYSKRYAMSAMLGLASDTDDDGNSAVYISASQKQELLNMLNGYPELERKVANGFKSLDRIPLNQFDKVKTAITKNIADENK